MAAERGMTHNIYRNVGVEAHRIGKDYAASGVASEPPAYLEDLLVNVAVGHIVGFDVDHASFPLDLLTLLEVEALQLRSCKIG